MGQMNTQKQPWQWAAEKKNTLESFGMYSDQYISFEEQYVQHLEEIGQREAASFVSRDLAMIYDHVDGENSVRAALCRKYIAEYYFQQEDYDSCLDYISEAVPVLLVGQGETDPHTIQALELKFHSLYMLRKYDEALDTNAKVIDAYTKQNGSEDRSVLITQADRAAILMDAERYAEALPVLECLSFNEEFCKEEGEYVLPLLFSCYISLGKTDELHRALDTILSESLLQALSLEQRADLLADILDALYEGHQFEDSRMVGLRLISVLLELSNEKGTEAKKALCHVYMTVALSCFNLDRPQESIKYAEKSIKLAKKFYKYDYQQMSLLQSAYDLVKHPPKKR